MTQPMLDLDTSAVAKTSLGELRKLCSHYQLKAAQGLAKKFSNGNLTAWFSTLEKARRYPQGEERLGLSFFLPGIADMELWSALDRFLWLCDEIWIAECKATVKNSPTLPYDYRETLSKAFAA